MRVEEFHEDSESESSVDEDLVNPNNNTQMGHLNSPPPDEARNVVDAVQLLVKQMSILTREWADMKKDLETIKAWQENVQDCADTMEVDEPEFDLPESIYDDSNDENSDEGYVSDPDEESDSEMSDSFPVHPSTQFEPRPQPSLKRWKVDERVEFGYTLRGIRKWVPGRIAHVRSADAYDVWLDTSEMERCVFAHELRSVQPGSIDHNLYKNDQLTEDVFSSVDLSSFNYYDLFDSNLLKTNTKKLSEVEQQTLQRRFDRAIADNPSLSLVNRVRSLPPSLPFRHASSLMAKDEIVFDEPEPDVPTQKQTLNDWKKFLITVEQQAVAEKKVNETLPTPLLATHNNNDSSSQMCVEVSAQLPLPENDLHLSPRDYLNFGTDANSGPILAYRNYTSTFPVTLFDLVSSEDATIVGWQQHGASFAIRDMDRFVELILPKHFQHNDITSFQRQLKLYGFRRIASYDKGAYFHPQFQRGQRELAKSIRRVCEKTSDTVGSNDGNGSGAGIRYVDTSAYGMTYLRDLPAGATDNLPGVTTTTGTTSVYAPTITTHADRTHNNQRTYPPIAKIRTALDRNLTTTEELFALFRSEYPKNATAYSSAKIDWKVGDCVQCYEPETSIWQQGRVTNVNSYGTARNKIYSYDVQLNYGEQRRFVPACFLRSAAAGTLYYESSEDSFAHRSVTDSDGAEWRNTHSNSALNCADSSGDDNASIYTDSTTSYRKRSQQPPLPSPEHYPHTYLDTPTEDSVRSDSASTTSTVYALDNSPYLRDSTITVWKIGDRIQAVSPHRTTVGMWLPGIVTSVFMRYINAKPCRKYDIQFDNGETAVKMPSCWIREVTPTNLPNLTDHSTLSNPRNPSNPDTSTFPTYAPYHTVNQPIATNNDQSTPTASTHTTSATLADLNNIEGIHADHRAAPPVSGQTGILSYPANNLVDLDDLSQNSYTPSDTPWYVNLQIGDRVNIYLLRTTSLVPCTITYVYQSDQPEIYHYDVQLDNGDCILEVWGCLLRQFDTTTESDTTVSIVDTAAAPMRSVYTSNSSASLDSTDSSDIDSVSSDSANSTTSTNSSEEEISRKKWDKTWNVGDRVIALLVKPLNLSKWLPGNVKSVYKHYVGTKPHYKYDIQLDNGEMAPMFPSYWISDAPRASRNKVVIYPTITTSPATNLSGLKDPSNPTNPTHPTNTTSIGASNRSDTHIKNCQRILVFLQLFFVLLLCLVVSLLVYIVFNE